MDMLGHTHHKSSGELTVLLKLFDRDTVAVSQWGWQKNKVMRQCCTAEQPGAKRHRCLALRAQWIVMGLHCHRLVMHEAHS